MKNLLIFFQRCGVLDGMPLLSAALTTESIFSETRVLPFSFLFSFIPTPPHILSRREGKEENSGRLQVPKNRASRAEVKILNA